MRPHLMIEIQYLRWFTSATGLALAKYHSGGSGPASMMLIRKRIVGGSSLWPSLSRFNSFVIVLLAFSWNTEDAEDRLWKTSLASSVAQSAMAWEMELIAPRIPPQIQRKKFLMALVNQLPIDSALMMASAPPMLDARVKAKSTKSIVDRSISPVQIGTEVLMGTD